LIRLSNYAGCRPTRRISVTILWVALTKNITHAMNVLNISMSLKTILYTKHTSQRWK
jgi:hypothetical protein